MIITVNNKLFKVPASTVEFVQTMVEYNKTDMEIAHAINRPRPFAHELKLRILEMAQMEKAA